MSRGVEGAAAFHLGADGLNSRVSRRLAQREVLSGGGVGARKRLCSRKPRDPVAAGVRGESAGLPGSSRLFSALGSPSPLAVSISVLQRFRAVPALSRAGTTRASPALPLLLSPSRGVTPFRHGLGTAEAPGLHSGGLPALSVRSSKALVRCRLQALTADFLLPVAKAAPSPVAQSAPGRQRLGGTGSWVKQ